MSLEYARSGLFMALKESASSGSGTCTDAFERTGRLELGTGTGAGRASLQYHALRTLPAGSETIDLTGGITNGLGIAVTFAILRIVYVRNAGNAALTLGGGTNAFASAFASTLVLPPGAEVLLQTADAGGWAVAAGTGDQLLVAGTAGQPYEIALAGE